MTGLIDGLWDVALLGGHRRDQVRNISTDVLRQVIKVAALSVALTVARTNPGAKRFRERHDLSSVIEITVRAAV
jgi:hypothetical protein